MEHDHRGISRARRTATCLLPWTETPSDLSGWCQPRDREGKWTCPWHWFTWFCRKWFSMVNSWVRNVRIFWGSLFKKSKMRAATEEPKRDAPRKLRCGLRFRGAFGVVWKHGTPRVHCYHCSSFLWSTVVVWGILLVFGWICEFAPSWFLASSRPRMGDHAAKVWSNILQPRKPGAMICSAHIGAPNATLGQWWLINDNVSFDRGVIPGLDTSIITHCLWLLVSLQISEWPSWVQFLFSLLFFR